MSVEEGQEISRSNCCARFFRAVGASCAGDGGAEAKRYIRITMGITIPLYIFMTIFTIACAVRTVCFERDIFGNDDEAEDRVALLIGAGIPGIMLGWLPMFFVFLSSYNFGKFLYRSGTVAQKFIGLTLSSVALVLSAGAALPCQASIVALSLPNERACRDRGLSMPSELGGLMGLYISAAILGAIVLANALCGAISGYVIERKNSPDTQRLLSEDTQPRYGMDI